jgi:hypothetical protein
LHDIAHMNVWGSKKRYKSTKTTVVVPKQKEDEKSNQGVKVVNWNTRGYTLKIIIFYNKITSQDTNNCLVRN